MQGITATKQHQITGIHRQRFNRLALIQHSLDTREVHLTGIGITQVLHVLKYAASQPRPTLSGKLVSNQLLMADLGPLIGVDSSKSANAPKAF